MVRGRLTASKSLRLRDRSGPRAPPSAWEDQDFLLEAAAWSGGAHCRNCRPGGLTTCDRCQHEMRAQSVVQRGHGHQLRDAPSASARSLGTKSSGGGRPGVQSRGSALSEVGLRGRSAEGVNGCRVDAGAEVKVRVEPARGSTRGGRVPVPPRAGGTPLSQVSMSWCAAWVGGRCVSVR